MLLEISDELYRQAENLGNLPRDEVLQLVRTSDGNSFKNYEKRRVFNSNFGWSVPCKEAVDEIKKYAREPLHDVMAGTGYWSRVLKKGGINVIASDIHKVFIKNDYHDRKFGKQHMAQTYNAEPEKSSIKRRNALKVAFDMGRERIKGDIFISWPPYESPVAHDALSLIPIGTRVFYVGEGTSGCTGDLAFHKNLATNFKKLKYVPLPTFEGIHDSLNIYEKISNAPIDPAFRGKVFDSSFE